MAKNLSEITFSRQSLNEGDFICLTDKVVTRTSTNGVVWATEIIVAQSNDGKNWFPTTFLLDGVRRASSTPVDGTCYPHFKFDGSKKIATLKKGCYQELLKTPVFRVEKIFSVRCNRKTAKDGDPTFAWNLIGLTTDKTTSTPDLKSLEADLETLYQERQSQQ